MNPNRVYSRDELEELVRQSNEGQKAMDEGKLTPFMRKSYEKMFDLSTGVGLGTEQMIQKLKEAQSSMGRRGPSGRGTTPVFAAGVRG